MKNNSLSTWLLQLSTTYRNIVSFFLCCSCVCIWFLGIYVPLNVWISHSRLIVKKMKDQHIMYAQAHSACQTLEYDIAHLTLSLNQHVKQAKEKNKVYNSILFLINQAHQHNLTLQHCSIDNHTDKQWYIENNISLKVAGQIHQLEQFFAACNTTDSKVTFNNFNVMRSPADVFSFSGVVSVIDSIKC